MVKVSVVECNNYDNELVYNHVKKAVNDIHFKIPKNKKVLLKPNVLSQHTPNEAITTHPAVVDAVCRLFLENDCEVTIGESSGFYVEGGTKKALKVSGMYDVAKKYGIKMIALEEFGSKVIKDYKAKILKEIRIANSVLDAEFIVNIPKLKTHGLMKFTGGVKNLLGVIPGAQKQHMHVIAPKANEFGELLLDIYQNVKPNLCVMDAVIGLEGNGPGTGGIPKQTGFILASENSIALDIVAQRISGFNPMEIATTRNAIKRGLFGNLNDVEIIGKFEVVNYKKPINATRHLPKFLSDIIFKQAMAKPIINEKKCKKCMICVNACPVKTIKVIKGKPKIGSKGCIMCFCCHELCPHKAIDLKRSFIIDSLSKIKQRLKL